MKDYRLNLSQEAARNVREWLTKPHYGEYVNEIESMITQERWRELEDAFFQNIEFGTGGMRGIVGVGSNRLNRATLGQAVQSLCLYVQQFDEAAPQKGLVIACDTRLSSPELSQYGALVAAANGFKTYIFDSYRSTPELSFAIRHFECATGFVITASHNAPEYNGFKAYWSDGAQLVPPHDQGVLTMTSQVEQIKVLDSYTQAVKDGKIVEIGEQVDEAYFQAVLAESMSSERNLKIAYTPLHGAGSRNTLPVLEKAGFEVVRELEQMIPDGHFPTLEDGRANPEKKLANDRVVALMLAEDADIAVSNDPDADRLGVIVRHQNAPIYLTGNQTAALVTDFALSKLAENNELTDKHYIVKTIVTTDLLASIAKKYNVECVGNLHVGFKWICEVINKREQTGSVFVTGSEESFGLMKGSYTRDKDGAVALLIAEYAAELKAVGKSLYDRLLELYQEHGMYVELLSTMTCEGAQGFADMKKIMTSVREEPIISVGSHRASATLDYLSLERKDLADMSTASIDAIPGNVYVIEFGDRRRRVTIRPSGTEPILKFYVQWYDDQLSSSDQYDQLFHKLDSTIKELEGLLLARLHS